MADTSRVPLLSVEGLKKYYTAKSGMFSRSAGVVRAVDGVSFQLFEGRDLLSMTERELDGVRGDRLTMIFQDPLTSLNPVFTIGS